MKKILYPTLLLFSCLSLVAFSPINKDASYLNLSNEELTNNMTTEVGSFTQSETSHETADKTVWNKRHKTWTDFTKSGEIITIENVINRN
ncbi:hypothetical protein [Psychroflexus sp. MBR-150]